MLCNDGISELTPWRSVVAQFQQRIFVQAILKWSYVADAANTLWGRVTYDLEKCLSAVHKLWFCTISKWKSPPLSPLHPQTSTGLLSQMCVFWYCRSLQCAPGKWHPLMSLFRVRAPPWVRRPKSSLSLLLSSISSRLINRSTNLDRLVSVTCGGAITPTTSTRRIFKVLQLPAVW